MGDLGPSATLMDIAGELQTRVEQGEFALCFDYVRADIKALPAQLRELADAVRKMESGP